MTVKYFSRKFTGKTRNKLAKTYNEPESILLPTPGDVDSYNSVASLSMCSNP